MKKTILMATLLSVSLQLQAMYVMASDIRPLDSSNDVFDTDTMNSGDTILNYSPIFRILAPNSGARPHLLTFIPLHRRIRNTAAS